MARKPKVEVVESAHAILSASGSGLWIACPGSAWLQKHFQDDANEAAMEGTFAHALAAARLKHYLAGASGVSAEEVELLGSPDAVKYYCAEMHEEVNGYVRRAIIDICKARQEDPAAVVLVEHKLDYSRWVPRGFGTGDLVIVSNGKLMVRDLKYGKGIYVDIEDNSQLMIYALGAYAAVEALYDFDVVECIIDQPRRGGERSMTLGINELLKWAEVTLSPAGHKAWRIYKGEEPPEYNPGDHCHDKFCRARHECRARSQKALEALAAKPADGSALTDEELAELLPSLTVAKKWIDEQLSYMLDSAVKGAKEWPGYKLVEGRSNRRIVDEEAVAVALQVEGFPQALLYDRSLKTLTELEELVGKKKFAELVPTEAIEKPPGKPVLAPESDPRAVWKSGSDADDEFDEEPVAI